MVTATQSILPIGFVLENNGRISLKELSDKLFIADKIRFRNQEVVENAIKENIACLKIEEDEVIYDSSSKSYTKHWELIERSAENYLYNKIPDMKKWALYDYKTRRNSERCNLNIDWKDIPLEKSEIEWFGLQPNCDFRTQKKEYCSFSCGVNINKAIGAIFAYNDDFSIIAELQNALYKRDELK